MFKKAVFFVLTLALASLVSAYSVRVTSPTNGQVFNIGDSIQADYNTDFDMNSTYALVSIGGVSSPLLYHVFFTSPIRRYVTAINTIGWPEGEAVLTFHGYYVDSNGFWRIVSSNRVRVLLQAPAGIADSNASANVARILPRTVYANGLAAFTVFIFPRRQFPGMIVRESFGNSGITYLSMASPSSLGDGTALTVDSQTKGIKVLARNQQAIGNISISYNARIPNVDPGTVLSLDGNWAIEGEESITLGDTTVTIGGFLLPDCPMTDQELLAFISRWSRAEITNTDLLQVIERWATC